MIKISREEVLKLADLSKIELTNEEVELVVNSLQDILTYAAKVQEIAADVQIPSSQNVNVFREDIIERTNPEPLLEQAPDRQDNLFVVPKILEN